MRAISRGAHLASFSSLLLFSSRSYSLSSLGSLYYLISTTTMTAADPSSPTAPTAHYSKHIVVRNNLDTISEIWMKRDLTTLVANHLPWSKRYRSRPPQLGSSRCQVSWSRYRLPQRSIVETTQCHGSSWRQLQYLQCVGHRRRRPTLRFSSGLAQQ